MEKEGKILFIAATHGDEGFSLEVLRKIKQRYPRSIYGYDRTVGNPKALKQNVRFVEADLNNSAPGNINSTIYEERRASQIVEASKKYSFAIDIHGAISDCGIVTIISYPTLANLLLAAALPFKRNVIWYMDRTPGSGPLIRFANCPGVAIECGPKSSDDIKARLEAFLEQILELKTSGNLSQIVNSISGDDKEFFKVYGAEKQEGNYTDFVLTQVGNEQFYPFLSYQYPGIACYKMEKIDFKDLFKYGV